MCVHNMAVPFGGLLMGNDMKYDDKIFTVMGGMQQFLVLKYECSEADMMSSAAIRYSTRCMGWFLFIGIILSSKK